MAAAAWGAVCTQIWWCPSYLIVLYCKIACISRYFSVLWSKQHFIQLRWSAKYRLSYNTTAIVYSDLLLQSNELAHLISFYYSFLMNFEIWLSYSVFAIILFCIRTWSFLYIYLLIFKIKWTPTSHLLLTHHTDNHFVVWTAMQ